MIALPLPTRRATLATLMATALLAMNGCGDSGSGSGDTDPASVVPGSAPAYVGVTVRPDSTLKTNAENASKALFGTANPGQAVVDLLSSRAKSLEGISFERDVDPWLGERIGLAALPVGEDETKPLLIAASRDDDKATTVLDKAAALSDSASFRGVDYERTPDGSLAGALVDGAVVLGDERAVKLAIAAAKDGNDLSESQRYRNAVGELPGGGIATAYLDIDRLAGTIARIAGGGTTGDLLRSLLTGQGDAIAATIIPEPGQLRLEAVGTATGNGIAAIQAQGGAAQAITTLPGDSWLALGVSDVGKTAELLLRNLTSAGGLQAIGINLVLSRLESSTGLSISADIFAWMGRGGLFVRGAGKGALNGALVVQSKDPAAMRRAVRRLRDALAELQLPGVPAVERLSASGVDEGMTLSLGDTRIEIAAAGDQLVIAIGPGALQAAIDPAAELHDNPGFKAAAARLDAVKPGFYLDFQQLADVVDSYAGGKEGVGALAQVLRGMTQAAGGGEQDGDTSRVTVVAGLASR